MSDKVEEWRALARYSKENMKPMAPSYLEDACDEIEGLRATLDVLSAMIIEGHDNGHPQA